MQIEDSFTVGQNQQSRLDQFQHNYCSLILESCIASSLVQKKKSYDIAPKILITQNTLIQRKNEI